MRAICWLLQLPNKDTSDGTRRHLQRRGFIFIFFSSLTGLCSGGADEANFAWLGTVSRYARLMICATFESLVVTWLLEKATERTRRAYALEKILFYCIFLQIQVAQRTVRGNSGLSFSGQSRPARCERLTCVAQVVGRASFADSRGRCGP